jgi:glucose-1-phosphate cytidylyltransferase
VRSGPSVWLHFSQLAAGKRDNWRKGGKGTLQSEMKVAILAGGKGTRLAEETEAKPKPMVHIGERPILWHIMMHYAHYGHTDFYIALGYKGDFIRRWLLEFHTPSRNLTADLGIGRTATDKSEDWTIRLIDTGETTQTGGRIKRLASFIGHETFMLTWGDGVSDVDLDKLLAFHRSHGKLATVTAVHPPARFGQLQVKGNRVASFSEKPQISTDWINGAFFVLQPEIFDYIEGDTTQWELRPLEKLAADGQLMAYFHTSFWQCMDNLHDKRLLEKLWESGHAPWKTWV